MGLKLSYKAGDTALTPEECEAVIPSHISNRAQLDEVEQDNIEDAYVWLRSQKKLNAEKIFSKTFQDNVHKNMFAKVWKWAGKTRTRQTNIGVLPTEIEVERKKLNDDVLFWVTHNIYPPLEIALRFHHRLVYIHCYLNGNGRHSRIMADVILQKIFNANPLQWEFSDLVSENAFRKKYIAALKAADNDNYRLLLNCVNTNK